jgi:hypothetical protein
MRLRCTGFPASSKPMMNERVIDRVAITPPGDAEDIPSAATHGTLLVSVRNCSRPIIRPTKMPASAARARGCIKERPVQAPTPRRNWKHCFRGEAFVWTAGKGPDTVSHILKTRIGEAVILMIP